MNYHEQMCKLARNQYEHHKLAPKPPGTGQEDGPWELMNSRPHAFKDTVAIEPVGFNRLLVHGSCEPTVFGNFTQDTWKYHPIVDLIGGRASQYLDYVRGKVIPPPPPYYDDSKAEEHMADLRKAVETGELYCEESELKLADLHDRIRSTDWGAVHTYLYENFDIEVEDVSRFGKVMAPPQFYYAVFAVKRLWELLEERA